MSAVLSTAEEDRLWSQLIRFIRDGALVPVTGPELLDIPGSNGESKNFYTLVAEEVAQRLGLEPPRHTPVDLDGPVPDSGISATRR